METFGIIGFIIVLAGSAGLLYSAFTNKFRLSLISWGVLMLGILLSLAYLVSDVEEQEYRKLGKEIRDCHAQMDLGKAETYEECGIDLEHPEIEKAMYWCKKFRACRRMGTEDPQPCLFYNQ